MKRLLICSSCCNSAADGAANDPSIPVIASKDLGGTPPPSTAKQVTDAQLQSQQSAEGIKVRVENIPPTRVRQCDVHFFVPSGARDVTLNLQPRIAWRPMEGRPPSSPQHAAARVESRGPSVTDDGMLSVVSGSADETATVRSSRRGERRVSQQTVGTAAAGEVVATADPLAPPPDDDGDDIRPPPSELAETVASMQQGTPAVRMRPVTREDFPGYSGEGSFQMGALCYGTYISQHEIRRLVQQPDAVGDGEQHTRRKSTDSVAVAGRFDTQRPITLHDFHELARRLRLTVDSVVKRSGRDAAALEEVAPTSDPAGPSAAVQILTVPGAAARHGIEWVKRHIDAAHVVVAGFYSSSSLAGKVTSEEYDKHLPIVGYTCREAPIVASAAQPGAGGKRKHGDAHRHKKTAAIPETADTTIPVHALHIYSLAAASPHTVPHLHLGVSRSTFVNTDTRIIIPELIQYAFPKDDAHCIAFTGIEDRRREALRVALQLDSLEEPAYDPSTTDITKIPTVTFSAIVYDVKPGRRYALLRFSRPAFIPASDFNHGLWDTRFNFTAPLDLAPRSPVTLPNFDRCPANATVAYRCVEVRVGGGR